MLIGFGVRVTSTGVKSYVLTHGIRRQRETIGRVGVITLQDARNEAKRILAEYTLGKDKVASVPWCFALDEYLGEIAVTRKPRTHYDYSRILDMYFRFGKTKMDDIGPSDLLPRIGKLKHIPAEQQHVFVVLRAFIRWAYRKHYIEHNPMDRMRQPKGYKARDRVLSDEELVRVWYASGDTTYGKIIKMLILTGQREGEITHMCQEMVGPDTIKFPDWLTKNSRAHEIPYGPMRPQCSRPTRVCSSRQGKETGPSTAGVPARFGSTKPAVSPAGASTICAGPSVPSGKSLAFIRLSASVTSTTSLARIRGSCASITDTNISRRCGRLLRRGRHISPSCLPRTKARIPWTSGASPNCWTDRTDLGWGAIPCAAPRCFRG